MLKRFLSEPVYLSRTLRIFFTGQQMHVRIISKIFLPSFNHLLQIYNVLWNLMMQNNE